MLLRVFVAGVLAVGYVGRGEIVRLWPPATKLYEELGVDVAAGIPGVEGIVAGLALGNVASERTEGRSEERRVGEECVRKCRFRGSAYHLKTKKMRKTQHRSIENTNTRTPMSDILIH